MFTQCHHLSAIIFALCSVCCSKWAELANRSRKFSAARISTRVARRNKSVRHGSVHVFMQKNSLKILQWIFNVQHFQFNDCTTSEQEIETRQSESESLLLSQVSLSHCHSHSTEGHHLHHTHTHAGKLDFVASSSQVLASALWSTGLVLMHLGLVASINFYVIH